MISELYCRINSFGLQVENLVEMTQEPKMHINMAAIIPPDLRTQLDDYLNTRSSVDFHANLPSLLQVFKPFFLFCFLV